MYPLIFKAATLVLSKAVISEIAIGTVSAFLGAAASTAGQIAVEKYFGLHDQHPEEEPQIHVIEVPEAPLKPAPRAPRLRVGKPPEVSIRSHRTRLYMPYATRQLRLS